MTTVSDVMTRDVRTMKPTDSVVDAARHRPARLTALVAGAGLTLVHAHPVGDRRLAR